jgi:epoxyqueuosine reductase
MNNQNNSIEIATKIKQLAKEIGFDLICITDPDLSSEKTRLHEWLKNDYAGDMQYLKCNFTKRINPNELLPNVKSILSLGMSYSNLKLNNKSCNNIASFALAADYHQIMDSCLKQLLQAIQTQTNIAANWCIFSGNGPILEKALAAKAGLGWIGKNSLVINKTFGSYIFLGEILTDLALPTDAPTTNHCGKCTKCSKACPTGALDIPYQVNAKKCISYLLSVNRTTIPEDLRSAIGTRIFGCEACQNVCPWNKKTAAIKNYSLFTPTNNFNNTDLGTLLLWDKTTFLEKTTGLPIQRISYEMWLRNIAVALGNSPNSPKIFAALKARQTYPDKLVSEHVNWALQQHS